MLPTSGTAVLRPDLAELTVEYETMQSRDRFIWRGVMPPYPVTRQTGEFPFLEIEQLLKLPDSIARNTRSGYARGEQAYGKKTYACVEHGFEEPVDQREAAILASYFDAEVVAAERAEDVVMRKQEQRVSNQVTGATIPGGQSIAAVAGWDNPATADPRADWLALVSAMRGTMGLIPNTAVVGWGDFLNLLQVDKVLEALKYTQPLEMQAAATQRRMVADYLGVQNLLVGDAQYDSAGRALPASLAEIWPTGTVYGIVVSMSANLMSPAFGRVFRWNEGASGQDSVVESYFEDRTRSSIVRVRNDVDENVIHAQAIGEITGV